MYYLSQFELWWGINRNDPFRREDPGHWESYLGKRDKWRAIYQKHLAGLVSEEEYARRQQEQREREEINRRLNALRMASDAWTKAAGRRYEECTFESFNATTDSMRRAVKICRDYADAFDSDSGNLILFGGVGTGKDHLACAICHDLLALPYYPVRLPCDDYMGTVWFPEYTQGSMALVTGPVIFSAARDAMKDGAERTFVKDYVQPTLLVISDPAPPSGEPLTGYQAGIITQIIDGRYSEMRPTIVTINCRDREQMDHMLTAPIADRLCDGAVTVACDWPSYRRVGRVTA